MFSCIALAPGPPISTVTTMAWTDLPSYVSLADGSICCIGAGANFVTAVTPGLYIYHLGTHL